MLSYLKQNKNQWQLRESLIQQLHTANAFWSYSHKSVESISDEELIEKVLMYLDLQEIKTLFILFKRATIKKVWRERLAIQGAYLFNLNVMIALYYFNIKQPEKYLVRIERQHLKRQITPCVKV